MIGIDEVGRGCWAGPLLVVAARQSGDLPKDLTDSKLLNKNQREFLFRLLRANMRFGEGWVMAAEIDSNGLTGAMRLGVERALNNLDASLMEDIILDGKINYCPGEYKNVRCETKADLNIPIVSAASIYAKVLRDRYMVVLGKQHTNYGFEKNVGYGTKVHREALDNYGTIQDVHRMSFKPMKALGGI